MRPTNQSMPYANTWFKNDIWDKLREMQKKEKDNKKSMSQVIDKVLRAGIQYLEKDGRT